MPSAAYLAAVQTLRRSGGLKAGPRRQPQEGARGPAPVADEALVHRPREPRPGKALDFGSEGRR